MMDDLCPIRIFIHSVLEKNRQLAVDHLQRFERPQELPGWKHGALAQAFLDALVGAADSQGIVRLSALTEAMENEVKSLSKDRQHLGMHINFNGALFVASHY